MATLMDQACGSTRTDCARAMTKQVFERAPVSLLSGWMPPIAPAKSPHGGFSLE
jgi:hypothetical protein